MGNISQAEISQYVEDNIGTFHDKRIKALGGLKLNKVLSKKNPYLFKAKFVVTADEVIKSLTDAYISSQEETIFGDWLEGLAIFVNEKVKGGWKSGIPGIDLEFDEGGHRFIVTIKSGHNWANSGQIKKMRDDFKKAKTTIRTSASGISVEAVNGCCYGRDNNPDKGDYFKYCGQRFWEFVSGDSEFYMTIVEPLGHQAKERNEEFLIQYGNIINIFTGEFIQNFCDSKGAIDWDKLVKFNSSIARPVVVRAKRAAKKVAKKVAPKVIKKAVKKK